MDGWSPDDRRDEVSFGRARSRWRPSRAKVVLVSVGLAAGLLIGGLLGVTVLGEQVRRPGSAEPPDPTVVAGVVEKVSSGGANGPLFALQLRNDGDQAVTVAGLRFDDLDSELVGVDHASLPPGAWKHVTFGAPADCFFGVPATLESARLTLRSRGEGDRELEIPLAGGGRVLLDYHAAMCAPQEVPRPQDLVGAWVVEEAFGEQDFVGIMVWIFGRDGSFVADPEGLAALDVEHGVQGRYSLQDGQLRIDVDGGYGCTPGDRSTWRPSLVDGPLTDTVGELPPLMTVAWVGGRCPDEMDGQIWILRRVLKGAR